MRLRISFALFCLGFCGIVQAQTPGRTGIRVKETTGIRRSAFPITVTAPFPQGRLKAAENARLVLNGKEVPAQYGAAAKWPDGSVQTLDIDFNASPGPMEELAYTLEWGEGVHSEAAARGFVVKEDQNGIDVGSVRFSKQGTPLMTSVKYRGEDIGAGINGLVVTDSNGQTHDLSTASSVKAEVLKRGPLVAVIRYTGNLTIDAGYSAPFVLTVEMPSSKSMVKFTASVDDPGSRLREIAIETPLALGALPWVWDFGTSRWTYGSLRNATDAVTLTQNVSATGNNDWKVITEAAGKQQPYEVSGAGRADLVRWGHVQDSKEVVAFILENSQAQQGTWRVGINGTGQLSFHYAFAPGPQHRIAVDEHFVNSPVQIGAATSPSALLSPLVYELSGAEGQPR